MLLMSVTTQMNSCPVSGCLDVEHGKLLIEGKYMEYPYQEICYSPEDMSADEVVWRNW